MRYHQAEKSFEHQKDYALWIDNSGSYTTGNNLNESVEQPSSNL